MYDKISIRLCCDPVCGYSCIYHTFIDFPLPLCHLKKKNEYFARLNFVHSFSSESCCCAINKWQVCNRLPTPKLVFFFSSIQEISPVFVHKHEFFLVNSFSFWHTFPLRVFFFAIIFQLDPFILYPFYSIPTSLNECHFSFISFAIWHFTSFVCLKIGGMLLFFRVLQDVRYDYFFFSKLKFSK